MNTTDKRHLKWVPIGGVDPKLISEARLQAHYAVQWLARTARAYILEQPDDGHTNLGWDGGLGAFVTHPLPDSSWLSLRLGDLTLTIHDGSTNKCASSLALNQVGDTQARKWLGERLRTRGFDAQRLSAPSPYEIPAHPIMNGEPYCIAGLAGALAELSAWFDNAALCLGSVPKKLMKRKFIVSPLRCWPHHFDIATLSTLTEKSTDKFRYIGAGLSPGDEYYDEPYFYVSVYPEPDLEVLPMLPATGHWHERDFVAAVAPAHRIAAAREPHVEIREFLDAVIDTSVKVLERSRQFAAPLLVDV